MSKKLPKKLWKKIKEDYPKVALQQPGILSVEVDKKNDRIIIKTIYGEVNLIRKSFKSTNKDDDAINGKVNQIKAASDASFGLHDIIGEKIWTIMKKVITMVTKLV
jgi:hypothetical protein